MPPQTIGHAAPPPPRTNAHALHIQFVKSFKFDYEDEVRVARAEQNISFIYFMRLIPRLINAPARARDNK